MSIIVTDAGFGEDTLSGRLRLLDLEALRAADRCDLPGEFALSLANNANADEIAPFFAWIRLIVIDFPSFADGRGFSLAKRLREASYRGTLRATGHVIADQYRNARRVGFDEVEISEDLAARQPERQWLARTGWQDNFYQKRLRAVA
ncbi:MAG: oxidoreductase [Ahrensia sp.]|nr:oxidoreductase [Ahrensia sp.]